MNNNIRPLKDDTVSRRRVASLVASWNYNLNNPEELLDALDEIEELPTEEPKEKSR